MTGTLPDDGETNVRVAARVRPLLPREKVANSCSCVTVHKSKGQVVVGTRRTFAFDTVFDTDSTQQEVYDSCVASLLTGCLQGYNATILAYGQTGSGKTHTMGTGQSAELLESTQEEEGITPKVIRNSFEYFESCRNEINFKASCSYLELYNEEIRDLLQPNAPKHLINIRENADGVIQIAGIHAEECSSAEDMLRCLNDGSVQRTTGATLMNEQSSRSHSIFTIIVEQRRRTPGADCEIDLLGNNTASTSGSVESDRTVELSYRTAKFHLVDLAGSERAKRTGAVGSRFKESVSINTGLLALGNVISALGDPAKRGCHVPYRESKLTRLLQDSLGGNSRTLMLACASCADSDFEETLNTLKYAHRARNIKNKPVVNHDPRVAQLAAMQDEIQALRNELQRVSEGGPGAGGLSGAGRGAIDKVEAPGAVIGELSEKLEAAERRNEELVERLVTVEADSETLRRSFVECYRVFCEQLPALAACLGVSLNGTVGITPSSAEASSQHGGPRIRQAIGTLSQALSSASKLLGESVPSTFGSDTDEALLDKSASSVAAASAEAGETARLQSLSEMRKDSTLLIRKYLDDIKRLENELVGSRRKIKQLQEELLEANDDLRKDEEIFDEKMREMKVLQDRNVELEMKLRSMETFTPGLASPPVHEADRQFFASRLEDRDEVRTDELELDSPRAAESAVDTGILEAQVDEAVQAELEESRDTQQQLEQEVEALTSNLNVKEENFWRTEQEWGSTKAHYQQRMTELQVELEQLQQQLATMQGQLEESAHLKEQTKQMEEEKQVLEQRIVQQLDCIKRKQDEFSHLRELREQDNKTIRDLGAEVQQMKNKLQDLHHKLQGERKRTARLEELKSQQIDELQRRLQQEGQKVKHLEAENLRQRESLKREQQKNRSATPLSRKGSATGMALREGPRGGTASGGAVSSTPTSGGGTSSTARANRLDQQINAHILRQEASQSLEEDIRKRDNLLRKREQYLSHRKKVTAKNTSGDQEAAERLQVLDTQLTRLDREVAEASANDNGNLEVVHELRHKQETVQSEREQLLQLDRQRQAEGLTMLRDVDERLEHLQDEIDFREARIEKSRQLLRPSSTASGSAAGHAAGGYPSQTSAAGQLTPEALDAQLADMPAEDAKELLSRYCEHIVRMRQREKQHSKRLTAVETQLEEKTRQVAELQQVVRRHDANATKAIAKVTKDYEGRIRHLLRQLNVAQQQQHDLQQKGLSSTEDLRSASGSTAAGGEAGGTKGSLAASGSDACNESEEIKMLRRDNHAYKMMNRELKKRVKGIMGQDVPAASGMGSARSSGAGLPTPNASGNGEEVASRLRQLEREKETLLDENTRIREENGRIKQYYSRFHDFQPSSTGRPKPGAPGPIPPDAAVVVAAAASAATIA